MLKKLHLLLFTFILTIQTQAIELDAQQYFILDRFFKAMVEDSEGGYVLDGVKPVCINGFDIQDCFMTENDSHRMRVCLTEGASLLKELNIERKDSDPIILHIYDKEDSFAKNSNHILLINKPLFLETVQSNLPLFQYVLGPEVTPLGLLNKLIAPEETFHSVVKQDKVLIGILLGFGVQNALYVSRVEDLQEALFAAEKPPLQSRITQLGEIQKELKEILLRQSGSSNNHKALDNLKPSFGFYSLQDEIKGLCQKIEVSSDQLAKNSPQFIFGRLKESKEANQLTQKLEQTQVKIAQWLKADGFLEKVLKAIYPQERIVIASSTIKDKKSMFNKSEACHLSSILAANIWRCSLKDEAKEYQEAFIKGMIDAERGGKGLNIAVNTLQYQKLKALAKIKSNIEIADSFFNNLEKDKSYHRLGSAKVYYQTIQEANEQSLESLSNVLLHYSIKAPDNQTLADTWMNGRPVSINLREVIPGFAWGLKGIRVGEIREIYIHPSHAYGIYTTLEKGIYLKATVQLLKLENPEKIMLAEPVFLELLDDKNIESKYKAMAEEVGYLNGYKVWSHYKKEHYYTFDQILTLLRQIQAEPTNIDLSSKLNQDLINRLHWNIYFGKENHH